MEEFRVRQATAADLEVILRPSVACQRSVRSSAARRRRPRSASDDTNPMRQLMPSAESGRRASSTGPAPQDPTRPRRAREEGSCTQGAWSATLSAR